MLPESLKFEILILIHESHVEIEKCKNCARQDCYWQHINKNIELFVKKCKTREKNGRIIGKETLQSFSILELLWNRESAYLFTYANKLFSCGPCVFKLDRID